MNGPTILVLVLIGVAALLALRFMIKRPKQGCGGDCQVCCNRMFCEEKEKREL
ncbi:MAG: FeoB-associated Cys-rich membrane protein [Firmicutes bacterium]|nr:FeoB-associated Cys-rich membrane protein [Bacillota bacterium]